MRIAFGMLIGLIVLLAIVLAIADGDSSSWPDDEYENFHGDEDWA